MFRSLLRDALITKQQPRLVINPQLLKRRLLQPVNPTPIMRQNSFMNQEIKVYNSSNKVPKFFNIRKKFDNDYISVIGKRLKQNEYIVKIIKHSNIGNKINVLKVTKKQVQELLDGNIKAIMKHLRNKKKRLTVKKKSTVKKKKSSVKKKKSTVKKKKSTVKKKKSSVKKKKSSVKKKKSSVKKKKSTVKKKSIIKKKKKVIKKNKIS